jgi:hypothetical protein
MPDSQFSPGSSENVAMPIGAVGSSKPKTLGPRHYWYFLRFSVFLILLPFAHFYGCLATDSDQAQTRELITSIHSQMASGNYDAIYDNADKSLQAAVTRDRHNQTFSSIASHYGYPSDCTVNDTSVKFGFGTKMIQSECTNRFSAGNTMIETFRFKKTDDQYRLYYYRYRIQP